MDHRHLNDPGLTLAAIDDIIARGSLSDWVDLDLASIANPMVMRKIRTIVMARCGDESSMNHDFWRGRIERRWGGA